MSLMDKLAKKEAEHKEKFGGGFWNPTEGEILEGTVVEMGTEKTQYRNDQAFLKIKTEDDTEVKVFCNAQLESLVADEDVNVKDYIAIKFLGARKSNKTGRTYKNYLLAKETPEPKVEEPKKEKKPKKSVFEKGN